MRVAALYDIHGNLPALDAVLGDLAGERVDLIVIGGDVVPGPQPVETLERLAALGPDVRFVTGNGDREVVAAYDEGRLRPEEESDYGEQTAAFAAARITPAQRDRLAAYEPTVVVEVDGLGSVVFCHGSPRSDTEILTTATDDARLQEILSDVEQTTVVGGHTHRQFDRRIARHRVVNAGSIGSPYEGRPGAYWALLGPDVQLRRTEYDVATACEQLRQTGYPGVEEALAEWLIEPLDPDEVAAIFERMATDG